MTCPDCTPLASTEATLTLPVKDLFVLLAIVLLIAGIRVVQRVRRGR